MHTITAKISSPKRTIKTYEWSIPSSTQELTAKNLRQIARIVSQPSGDPIEQKMEALIRIGRITRPDLLNGAQVMQLLALLDFLDDANIKMDKPIIKWIGIFKAPRRLLQKFSGNQMALCDTILQAIQQQNDTPSALLADFCAANTTLLGGMWRNFIAEYLAKPFFRYFVRRSTKLALLIQYRAMRRIFPEKYENAFSNDGTAERFPSLGWPGTFVKLAGDKFGNPKMVKQTPAHDLFTYLEQVRRDEIRMASQNRMK